MKNKLCLSLSEDISDFIKTYSKEKKISLSVAAERILLKGIEAIENNNNSILINKINELLSTKDNPFSSKVKEEENEEVISSESGNLDLSNEDDLAIWEMFNNV